jgi:hypothetical protein
MRTFLIGSGALPNGKGLEPKPGPKQELDWRAYFLVK